MDDTAFTLMNEAVVKKERLQEQLVKIMVIAFDHQEAGLLIDPQEILKVLVRRAA